MFDAINSTGLNLKVLLMFSELYPVGDYLISHDSYNVARILYLPSHQCYPKFFENKALK